MLAINESTLCLYHICIIIKLAFAVNPLYPVNITMLIDTLALCNIYWQAVDQSPQWDKYYHKKVDKSTTITDQNCANYVAEGSGKRTQAIIHKDN